MIRSLTTVTLFTVPERENGWDEETYKQILELYKETKNYENAHRSCRDINKTCNSFINIPLLITSATLTTVVAIDSASIIPSTPKYYIELGLTILTTALSGMNTFYHNAENSQIHHEMSKKYYTIAEDIKRTMVSRSGNFSELYNGLSERVSNIRGACTISIFGKIRKKYNVVCNVND